MLTPLPLATTLFAASARRSAAAEEPRRGRKAPEPVGGPARSAPPARRGDRRAAGADRIVLRAARASDAQALLRLASLDARSREGERLAGLAGSPADGPLLVAELDGVVVAALDVPRDLAVSDPFSRAAPARELLEVRARQLRPAVGPSRPAWSQLLSHLYPRDERA